MIPSSEPPPADGSRLGEAVFAFVLTVAAIGLVLILAGMSPTSSVSSFRMRRVQVQAAQAPAEAIAQGCPELTNPGGGLDWTPSANAGPVPTNGRVQLPALGVEAPIVKVGVDTSERMVVPHNARDIAWLDQGGFPGKTNNVVLAGHIAYNRVAGSFNRIKELRPGDEIAVVIDSKKLRYRVVFNCQFHRDTNLADHIMGYTVKPSLTLISCGGVFDTAARTHTDRVTVRAEQII